MTLLEHASVDPAERWTFEVALGERRQMARKLRVEHEGAICHVINREDRREPIFRDDVDRGELEIASQRRRAKDPDCCAAAARYSDDVEMDCAPLADGRLDFTFPTVWRLTGKIQQ